MQGQGGPLGNGPDDKGPDGQGFDGREGVRGEMRGFPGEGELQGGERMGSTLKREPDEQTRDEDAARLAREAAEDEEFDAAVAASRA